MRNSRIIAISGITATLSVIIMFTINYVSAAKFVAPIFTGFILIVNNYYFGTRNALLVYVAVALLSFMVSPNKTSAFEYAVVFGYYPIIQPLFKKIKTAVIRVAAKVLYFEFIGVLSYFVITKLFIVDDVLERIGKYLLFVFIIYNVMMLVYDMVISGLYKKLEESTTFDRIMKS